MGRSSAWSLSSVVLSCAVAAALVASLLAAPPSAAQVRAQQDLEPIGDPHDACPLDSNPAAPFTDRASIPSVHRLNVDCAFNTDVAEGYANGRFGPADRVRRDQFASFLVRMLEAGDVDLPAPEDQGFVDIAGNPHEDAINVLIQTEIAEGVSETRYDPAGLLRRDQTATFVLRAAAYVEDISLESLQRATGPFSDVPAANAHSDNINGARHFQLTIGRTATTYEPAERTRRDQMASFLMRLLAALAEEGHLIPPEHRVVDIEFDTRVAVNPVGTDHTATVTATDSVGDPVVDAPVRFEVFRHDNPVVEAPAFTYLTALEQTAVTDADGQASITYTGPDHAADDRIAVCVPRRDSDPPTGSPFCGVVVDDEDGEGETVVPTDEVPADVGQKKWGFPADALTAEATGVLGQLLGSEIIAQPTSSISLPGPGGERSAEDTDGLEIGELEGLLFLGVTTTRAAGDLDFGIARAEARTVDLELLSAPLAGPVVGADVIETISTTTCEGPYEDLADASDSTFVGLTVAGSEIPVDVPPNTEINVPLVADVVINEVVEHTDGDEFGYTVRGLRITLLPPLGIGDPLADVIVGETTTTADCVDLDAAALDALPRDGSDAAERGDHLDTTTLDVDPRPWIDELEAATGEPHVTPDQRAELDARYGPR